MKTVWKASAFKYRWLFQFGMQRILRWGSELCTGTETDTSWEEDRAVRYLCAHPILLCGCITILTAVELSWMKPVFWRINCSSGGLVSKLHTILISFSYCMIQSFKIGPWIFYKTWIKDPSQIR